MQGDFLSLSHQASELLFGYLEERISHLHGSIVLQDDNGPEGLALFIERYVDMANDVVIILDRLVEELGISGKVQDQITTAKGFLEIPASIVSRDQVLEATMYQAYLAWRLVEELNDVVHVQCGTRLISLDVTTSNLIVHHIIGEPFANQLDAAIQNHIDRLARSTERDFIIQSELQTMANNLDKVFESSYPCLAGVYNIRLAVHGRGSGSN